MDDDEAFLPTIPNPNFRVKASKSLGGAILPRSMWSDPLAWQAQQQDPITAPYVNHLVSMGGSSIIVAGFSSPSDSLKLFDVTSGRLVPQRSLNVHQGGITGIKVDPQDSHDILWSSGKDGKVQGVDLRVANDGNVCLLKGNAFKLVVCFQGTQV